MFQRALLLVLAGCGESTDSLAGGKKGGPASPEATPAATPASSAAPVAGAIPDVVATIGGQPVTWAEVFESSAQPLVEAEVALQEARKQALDGMILQKLVEAAAAKQGTTPEALVQAEMAKVPPVTPQEVDDFYMKNQRQMQGPLEQMRPQIEAYLQQQRGGEAIRALAAQMEKEAGVQRFLPYFRVAVDPGAGPRLGPAGAPVQIVEFSDFQCPYCGVGAEVVHQLAEKYGEKVSIVFKHYPLPMHPQAKRAAEAAMCANDQGQFWTYHDALFADRKAWTDADFGGYAKATELDVKKFEKCLSDNTHAAAVEADMETGRKVGMGGTPGFYVNGVVLQGARPLDEFVAIIDAELAKVN